MSPQRLANRRSTFWLNCLGLLAAALAVTALSWKNSQASTPKVLLNASFDPTREMFRDLNPKFVKAYETDAGVHVVLKQSNGGSEEQVKAILGGLDPDVVTLALPSDVNTLQRKGLIAANWSTRLPYGSKPYSSTIVFVVRKGNPKSIRDWPDLIRKGVSVVTPDPKTSGNGKLSVLAAWGSVVHRGGTPASALAYLSELYDHVAVLDASARGAHETVTQDKVGDVHLAWENEALLETAEFRGNYEIVYPPVSIRAEPAVAWLDAAVARHHSEAPAKAYLQFLFTAPAQEVIAQHGYRPADPAVFKKYAKQFPQMDLFSISEIASDWDDADVKFFAQGALFDQAHPVTVALAERR